MEGIVALVFGCSERPQTAAWRRGRLLSLLPGRWRAGSASAAGNVAAVVAAAALCLVEEAVCVGKKRMSMKTKSEH